jgi:hypothetical protein
MASTQSRPARTRAYDTALAQVSQGRAERWSRTSLDITQSDCRRARLYASGARAGLEVVEDVLGEQRLDERDAPAHRLLPGLRRLEHQALDHLRHRPRPRRACTIKKWFLIVYYCKQERSGGEVASSEGCRDV